MIKLCINILVTVKIMCYDNIGLFMWKKVTSFDSVDLPESEDPKNVVRVGWSTDSASLQLGTFTIIISPTVKFRK